MLVKVHDGNIKQLGENGEGIAVIATLNVIDRDGDVTVPGAFGEQVATMVPAHDWGQAPIGKVRIHEEGSEVLADFQLNLKTDLGRNWYEALRFDLAHPPAKQQYSYSYSIPQGGAESGEFSGKSVRFLKSLQVHEVSPVLLGAGVDTRTLALKGLWLTADQVKLMCPPCAEKMRKRHITKIKLSELIKQEFDCPKPFSTLEECVERFSGDPEIDDPEAFCAAWEAACGEPGPEGDGQKLKGLWLTVDQVKRLCPSCAERMRSKGVRKIALAELAKSLHGEDELELVEAIAHVNEAAADLSEAAWLDDPERRQEAVNNAIAHLERAEERAAAVLDPDAEVESEEGKSFAGYENFDECVAQNQDKEDPEAYCAAIQAQVEGEAAAGKRRRLRVGDGQKTMVEQIAATVATVEATVKRLEKINDLRLKDGRDLSEARKADIAGLVERLNRMLRGPSPKEITQRYFDLKARTIKGLDPG